VTGVDVVGMKCLNIPQRSSFLLLFFFFFFNFNFLSLIMSAMQNFGKKVGQLKQVLSSLLSSHFLIDFCSRTKQWTNQ